MFDNVLWTVFGLVPCSISDRKTRLLFPVERPLESRIEGPLEPFRSIQLTIRGPIIPGNAAFLIERRASGAESLLNLARGEFTRLLLNWFDVVEKWAGFLAIDWEIH